MKKEHFDYIFDRFYQLTNHTDKITWLVRRTVPDSILKVDVQSLEYCAAQQLIRYKNFNALMLPSQCKTLSEIENFLHEIKATEILFL